MNEPKLTEGVLRVTLIVAGAYVVAIAIRESRDPPSKPLGRQRGRDAER